MLDLIFALRQEMASFEDINIDYEEKAFYDILIAVKKQFAFVYPDDKTLELTKAIKATVDDNAKHTDWSGREDIKAELKTDIIVKLAEFGYPSVTMEAVCKNVLEQAESFKRNRR